MLNNILILILEHSILEPERTVETVYGEFSGKLSGEILGLFSRVTGSCRALGATPGRAREGSEQRGPGAFP